MTKAENTPAITPAPRKRSKLTPKMEAMKWKKGDPSPNPGGRPKKKPITELYEKLLGDPAVMEQVQASVVKMLTSGRMVGQLQLKEMAERVEGKVSQTLEVDGEIAVSLVDRIARARKQAHESR